jgi:glyoxylase-like metal-dependent hydrolase (beta-lactamase superfamily II)
MCSAASPHRVEFMQTFDIAPGVVCFPLGFVNVYGIETAEGAVLVDTGMSMHAATIREAFEHRFGGPAKAIVLTHGHQDHSGAARELAQQWGVRVYVHPLERPYLVGKSRYPAPDPTVGGPLALISRFTPWPMTNLTGVLETLEEGGVVPFAPGWEWLAAPGHSPGQIVLWNAEKRVLLAGDSLATADFDTFPGMAKSLLLKHSHPYPAGAPFICNWARARLTAERLAELEPTAVGAGHGEPLIGNHVPQELRNFASHFRVPSRGRYVKQPAETDESGVTSVPPPAKDTFARNAALAGLAVSLLAILLKRRK